MSSNSRWDLMQSFVQVVDAGSFTVAAERLQVSKSLLSKKVSQLERNLGTQLLVRTTRHIRPTDAGQTLFLKCERLFNDLEEAEQAAANLDVEPIGHLRVACTDVLGEQYVARAAAEVCNLYPQLKIDVHVTMRTVDLVAEGYDIAIRYGDLPDSSLKARKVYQLPHVVCASPAYFSRCGIPDTIESLSQHNCLVATFEPCAIWRFKVEGKDVTLQPKGCWQSNSGSALVSAAVEGMGICRLPELYVRPYIETGRLIPIFESFRSDTLAVWMVYPNTRYTPAKVRMFIDYFSANIERLTQTYASATGVA